MCDHCTDYSRSRFCSAHKWDCELKDNFGRECVEENESDGFCEHFDSFIDRVKSDCYTTPGCTMFYVKICYACLYSTNGDTFGTSHHVAIFCSASSKVKNNVIGRAIYGFNVTTYVLGKYVKIEIWK